MDHDDQSREPLSPAAASSSHVATTHPQQQKKTLGVAGLVVIGFFWVSGGIYGNEALACAAPPLYIVLFTLITPLVFSLPIALITAELATTFPADGGQVVWVAKALGSGVGAHNAYYVWLVNIIDASIYPQLLVEYVRKAFHLSRLSEALVCLGMVAAVSAVSLMGVQWIERSQAVLFVVTMVPCLLYIGFGLPQVRADHLLLSEGDVDWSLLVSWVLWLYSGVSSLGALAGEVAAPRTTCAARPPPPPPSTHTHTPFFLRNVLAPPLPQLPWLRYPLAHVPSNVLASVPVSLGLARERRACALHTWSPTSAAARRPRPPRGHTTSAPWDLRYPRAIALLFPLIVALNLAPFVVSLSLSPDRAKCIPTRGSTLAR